MQVRVIACVAASVVLLGAIPAVAHHSNSAYQVDQVQTLVGVVKEWKWSNPHTWLYVMVDDGKGGKVEWAVEGRAPGVLGRVGWDRTILKAGDKVTVHMSPAKDGSHVGIIARVTKEDGTILGNGGANQ
jgi:translation initiation factor IF-1